MSTPGNTQASKYTSGKLNTIGEREGDLSRRGISDGVGVGAGVGAREADGHMSMPLTENSYSNKQMHLNNGRYYLYGGNGAMGGGGTGGGGASCSNRVRGDSLVDHLGIQTPMKESSPAAGGGDGGDISDMSPVTHSRLHAYGSSELFQIHSSSGHNSHSCLSALLPSAGVGGISESAVASSATPPSLEMSKLGHHKSYSHSKPPRDRGGEGDNESVFSSSYWSKKAESAAQAAEVVSAAIDSVALAATGAADSVAEAAMEATGVGVSREDRGRSSHPAAPISTVLDSSSNNSNNDRSNSNIVSPEEEETVGLLHGQGGDNDDNKFYLTDGTASAAAHIRSRPQSPGVMSNASSDYGGGNAPPPFDENEGGAPPRGLNGLPLMIVGNKIDKLSAAHLAALRRSCSNHVFIASASESHAFDPKAFGVFFGEIHARKSGGMQ